MNKPFLLRMLRKNGIKAVSVVLDSKDSRFIQSLKGAAARNSYDQKLCVYIIILQILILIGGTGQFQCI